MKQKKIAYNNWTYNLLINMYGGLEELNNVTKIFDKMIENGLTPDASIYNSLITIHGKAGNVPRVKMYFNEMQEKYGIQPDVVTYGTLIDMYNRQNNVDEVDKYIKAMKENNIEIGDRIFSKLNENYDVLKEEQTKVAEQISFTYTDMEYNNSNDDVELY